MAISNQTSPKNIFFYCIPAWGHTRPIPTFGYRILESRPDVVITLFTFSLLYPKVLKEMERIPEEYRKRLHVIDVAGPVTNPQVPVQTFEPAFKALWKGEPIKCLTTGKVWTEIPRPVVAVLDPFAGYAIEAVRDTTFPSGRFPILAWFTAPVGPALRLFGPKELGGIGVSGRMEMKSIRYADEEEVNSKLKDYVHPKTGQVVEIPGVPTMYDYEYDPQELPIPTSFMEEIGKIYLPYFDGVLAISSSAYEGEAMETMRKWLNSLGHVLYPIGPILEVDSEPKNAVIRVDGEPKDSPKVQAIEFLDRMREKYGDKSVIYISFGTIFWPSSEEKIWAVIDDLLEGDTPVIFAHPSPFTTLDEEKLNKLKQNPIALEFQWAPQEAILMHPATGWFISHGGWNSIQEGFLYKVPQIFWPFAADQPFNSAIICQVHKAGFELINVRTGKDGAQLPYSLKDAPKSAQPTFTVDAVRSEMRDLLVRLKGNEGLKIRKNYEALGEAVLRGWNKDGEARKNMEMFLEKFVD